MKIIVNVARELLDGEWHECEGAKLLEAGDGSFNLWLARDLQGARDADARKAQEKFDRDVREALGYFAGHQEPDGGWTPEHLMYGAKSPCLDDADYARRVWERAVGMRTIQQPEEPS